MAPAALAAKLAAELAGGDLLGALVESGPERDRLAGSLARELEIAVTQLAAEQARVVVSETSSEHWLTRSWRPVLMLVLTGLLVVIGLLLPLAEAVAGHALLFRPRWDLLPPEFWSFLMVGTGGYIGGRSLEKIAAILGDDRSSRMRPGRRD